MKTYLASWNGRSLSSKPFVSKKERRNFHKQHNVSSLALSGQELSLRVLCYNWRILIAFFNQGQECRNHWRSSGIGPIIARWFVKSGASTISILGCTQKPQLETKTNPEKNYPSTKSLTYIADTVDKDALTTIFEAIISTFGTINILVANAGYLPTIASIAISDLEDW